ncbi:MAG: hypothetical protein KAQ98_09695 [Bacteriovoracaceae bacterium]|nr:hypothetical protein [Bacteriovoracaceae bacterium]
MKIFLCGFMGAGKTRLLRRLEGNSDHGWSFLDLDAGIEQDEKMSIDSIVEKNGWDYFRKLERDWIERILDSQNGKIIVAIGGGALCGGNLEKILKVEGASLVWIKTPLDICIERISSEDGRPLVCNGVKYLKDLYRQRCDDYEFSQVHLDVEEQDSIIHPDGLLECCRDLTRIGRIDM